jgi:hypothetical protein
MGETMNTNARRATAAVGTLAAAVGLMAAAPAQSLIATASQVTVATTDTTPASGETFRLYGAVWSDGARVPATIHVKTFRNGEWVQLDGAVMKTNRDDRYNIRVILQMKGERQLRVVGDPAAAGVATSRRDLTVVVH